jgi:cytochrome c-type biogenesis protein CcmF
MDLLGRGALLLALVLLLHAALAGAAGALRRSPRLTASARNALVGAFAATALAAGVLVASFVVHDFSITYVAHHSSRELPLGYTLAALWSGQEGSLVLWLLILTGTGSAAALVHDRFIVHSLPWVVPVLGAVGSFFAFLLVVVSPPFATQVAPLDGSGLHPSLQNPYVLAHPPMLYLGYVGLTIPFAFAMAALLGGRLDERWIVATRRWTLGAWTFLGIGILLGAKWAYAEIGWGGYYAWDPVENAALMPWLAGTAYLHSVIVQEKKDVLRVWNVVLVSLAFVLALFGTFLTRSGIINSVHSFAQSSIGAWFLGFIALVTALTALLIAVRLPLLRSPSRLQSLVSRESAFLYNNLLFVAFCLTVLWGVAFPILTEAVRGEAMTIGPPYYNFFLKFFGLPLLFLMGIGPLVAWRRSSLRSLRRNLLVPAGVAVGAGALLAVGGAGSNVPALVAYGFCAFVLTAIGLELWRGTRARRNAERGWAAAFTSLVARNRRRYGGYVVHAAVVLLVIGVAGSSGYGVERTAHLEPGQALTIADYELRYLTSTSETRPNAVELRALVDVRRGGERLGELSAGKNRYFAEADTSNEVAIRSDWARGEDLFLIVEEFSRDGSVWVKVLVNPLVNLIWLAGLVFVVGAAIAVWPPRSGRAAASARAAEPVAAS